MSGKRIWVWVVLIAAVAAAGCGKKREAQRRSLAGEALAEKLVEHAAGGKAKVDIAGDRVTIKSQEGEFVVQGGENAKLPDNFPADVPVVKGAKIRQTISAGRGQSVVLDCSDTADAIADFYGRAMQDGGWKEEMTMRQEALTMLGYSKEQRHASIMINDSGKERMVTLTVSAR